MTWQQITCAEREALVDEHGRSYNGFDEASGIRVIAGRSDLDGQYGIPQVMTEWGHVDTETPVLKDIRWPHPGARPGPDAAPCEHYRWTP